MRTIFISSITEGRDFFRGQGDTLFFAPLLTKTGLDDSFPSSYRPAWNIPFISKVLERIVNRQLFGYQNEFNSFPDAQPTYRRFHSTETAVFKVFSDIVDAVANGKIALLLYYWFNGGFRHRRPRHFAAATIICIRLQRRSTAGATSACQISNAVCPFERQIYLLNYDVTQLQVTNISMEKIIVSRTKSKSAYM